MNNNKI